MDRLHLCAVLGVCAIAFVVALSQGQAFDESTESPYSNDTSAESSASNATSSSHSHSSHNHTSKSKSKAKKAKKSKHLKASFIPDDTGYEEPRQVSQCFGGQVWNDCGTSCPNLCNRPDASCIEVCVAQCECAAGHRWHEQVQHCYPQHRCPPDVVRDACFHKDIVFALDASGSVGEDDFEMMKIFLREFVEEMPIGPADNQVSIITYSTEAFVHAELGKITNKFELMRVIDDLKLIGQRTNTSGAIRAIHNEFMYGEHERESAENVAIVITDGKSNTDEHLLKTAVETARRMHNIRFFTLGVGPAADLYEMLTISNLPPLEHAIFVADFDALLDSVDVMFDHICKKTAKAAVELVYDIPDTDAYTGSIVFVVDASPSVSREEFQVQLDTIRNIAHELGVTSDRRLGVVQFGVDGITHIALDAYESLTGFLYQLDRVVYSPHDVNLAAGIDMIENILLARVKSRVISREDLRPQVVLMSSGRNVYNVELFKNKLAALKTKFPELHVLPVGIHDELSSDLLLSNGANPELYTQMGDHASHEISHYIAWLIAANAADAVWSCDFEVVLDDGGHVPSLCGLNQPQSMDDFDWLISDGPTASAHTGPNTAASGTYYAHIEATDRQPGEQAVLLGGDEEDFAGPVCFSFKYNMHGWHTGTLEVVQYIPGYDAITLWRMSGEQGEDWHEALVQIYAVPTSRFGLRATRGTGFSSDIAVDTMKSTLGPCPVMKQFLRDPRMAPGDTPPAGTVRWSPTNS